MSPISRRYWARFSADRTPADERNADSGDWPNRLRRIPFSPSAGRFDPHPRRADRRDRQRARRRRRCDHHQRKWGNGNSRIDRLACASGHRRLQPAAEGCGLHRQLRSRRRHPHDIGRRGSHAGPSDRRHRHKSAGDRRRECLGQLPPRRHEGARWRAALARGSNRSGLRGDGKRRRKAPRRSGLGRLSRLGQNR